MTGFVVRRLAGALASLLGVTVLVTLFLDFLPGDPVEALLGDEAAEVDVHALRASIGIDLPPHRQVLRFLGELASGELRSSVPPFTERVAPRIVEKAPRTALLAVVATALAVAIALPLGVVSARRRGTWIDAAATGFALVGASLPRSWLGPVLILVFAIRLDWLPALGGGGPASLVLPALTLALAMSALVARIARASVLEVLRADFVTAARARGLGEGTVLWRHVLRNALVPVVTVVGLQFGSLLTGAIVTEKVFNWPGLGTLLLTAIAKRDYNTVRAVVLLFTAVYVAVNLLTDLAYAAVDPRVRVHGRSR